MADPDSPAPESDLPAEDHGPPDPDFGYWVALRREEIALQQGEIADRQAQRAADETSQGRSFTYAMKALECDAQDQQARRGNEKDGARRSERVAFGLIAAVVAIVMASLFLDKTDALIEALKYILAAGGGGGVAYGVGRSRGAKDAREAISAPAPPTASPARRPAGPGDP